MQRSNSWKPHAYPIQSAPPRLPTPPPAVSPVDSSEPIDSEKDFFHTPTSDPPQVPRNIRALKDGRSEIKGRNIIVCLDGTGDKFDADNSNIVAFVRCLKKSDPSQITYYQPGIGTYNGGGLSNGINAAFDMAVGSGLGVHIRDAYRFLMQNYLEHDRIHLLGFSRGAYTARCLAGMIHKVGLLPAHNISQVPFAYQYYKDDTTEGWKMSSGFKRTFCMDVSVHFIGVFDSVASVGFIPRRLPLSSTPTNKASYFRHAMALDEHRAKFKVCRFQTRDHTDTGKWTTLAEEEQMESTGQVPNTKSNGKLRKGELADADAHDLFTRLKREAEECKVTDAYEVWFAGCHADVGGGAVANEVRHKLSQVPLRWMIRQCFECDTGIIFKSHRLAEEGLDIHTLWPVYQALDKPTVGPPPSMLDRYHEGALKPLVHRSSVLEPVNEKEPQGLHHVNIPDDPSDPSADHWTPEQVEDYFDAMSPINDQLVVAKAWWILEFWPIKVRVQDKQHEGWTKKVAVNMGRFRPVQEKTPNLHWTVERRMQADKYKIRTRVDRDAEWKIVV